MGLSGRSFDPTTPPAQAGPTVDYALARRAVLSGLRRGSVHSTDVCDAHPELIRAGKNIGQEIAAVCPVCSHDTLRWVRYVYGEELKSNSGRVVYPPDWLTQLAAEHDQFTCYVVEVCVDCSWNHLIRSYLLGRLWPVPQRAARARNGSVPLR
ncbi:MAG: DUF5318 domain-containing protein [Actinomycetota bacterium]|nr:DUF5318 domain-containing protein [Actinomycetota bacterium]